MKLLTVTHFFERHRGGIEIVAGKLVRELRALGHRVEWAAADVDPAPDIAATTSLPLRSWNGIERITGLPMPIPTPAALLKLAKAARSADAILVHDGLYATSIAALIAGKLARKPVLLIQHIGAIPFANPAMAALMRIANRIVTRVMLAAADQVVFISETTAGHFQGALFKRPPLTIFNGVDTSVFKPGSASEHSEARQRLALPADRPIAVFVGRFVEKKGLSVIRELAKTRPDTLFALAGRGPIDPALWGLENVRLFTDLAGVSLAALYQAGDLFVLPSVGEGFPLVIQEALACGLPVLCGSESALADPAAMPMLTGLPVDLSDPAGTAARFADALDRSGSADENDRAAFADARYSWTRAAAIYDQALTTIAEARPSLGIREAQA